MNIPHAKRVGCPRPLCALVLRENRIQPLDHVVLGVVRSHAGSKATLDLIRSTDREAIKYFGTGTRLGHVREDFPRAAAAMSAERHDVLPGELV